LQNKTSGASVVQNFKLEESHPCISSRNFKLEESHPKHFALVCVGINHQKGGD
jgi:hypothetical protein